MTTISTPGAGDAPADPRIPPEGTRVRVIGPARIDGTPLTRRQATLVAALALHRGRAVPARTLIDLIWPDGAPATARASLQNQVARLRRRFGPELVQTSTAGYRLGSACDVERLEVEVARLLGRTPGVAVGARLAELLDAWRSTPYADLVDDPVAEAEQARLGELRCRAEEHLAASCIVAGRLDRAVTTLESLVAVEPYRERRWELLLTALDAAGRRAEALRSYRRYEAQLLADLGTGPSAAMRALADHLRTAAPATIDLTDHDLPPRGRQRCTASRGSRARSPGPSFRPR